MLNTEKQYNENSKPSIISKISYCLSSISFLVLLMMRFIEYKKVAAFIFILVHIVSITLALIDIKTSKGNLLYSKKALKISGFFLGLFLALIAIFTIL